VATLLDLATGAPLAVGSMLSKQQPFGADVITRISSVMLEPGNLGRLTRLAHDSLSELAGEVCEQARVDPLDVFEVAVAGNATMIHLALGIDPEPLGVAPFILSARLLPEIMAADVGLTVHPRARAVVLPAFGAYVGGDITAGLLASGMNRDSRIRLFIDIGTNCEIVLGNRDWLLATAAPAGPAFEGAAIRCGMRAADGAIESVALRPAGAGGEDGRVVHAGGPAGRASEPGGGADGPGSRAREPGSRADGPGSRAREPGSRADGPGSRGREPGSRADGPGSRAEGPGGGADGVSLTVIGDAEPAGLCGSGLVDAVASLIDVGLLDHSGRFVTDERAAEAAPGLARRLTTLGKERVFVLHWRGDPGDVANSIFLTQRDVRELQFAKAAIASGWNVLLEESGLAAGDIVQVLLAGSFGSYLSPANAIRLGLVPKLPVLRVVSAGNVAGEGAKMVLLSVRERAGALALLQEVRYVELSDRADFNDRFIEQLQFPG
jgi:uncharacterized 2Fe-2S/4Fe-4S cluster protein (DUF4445 family)